MNGWEIAFSVLGLLGIGGGGTAWFLLRPQMKKLKAEANHATMTTAIERDTAEDEHLKTIVDYVVAPLKSEVQGLRGEVKELKDQLHAFSRRYRLALNWMRDVLAWHRAFHPDIEPPPPSVPPEVQEDI